jgi:hypothetical protein
MAAREGVSTAVVRRIRRTILADTGRELRGEVLTYGLWAPLLMVSSIYVGSQLGVAAGIATYTISVITPVVLGLVDRLWWLRRRVRSVQTDRQPVKLVAADQAGELR